MTALNRFPTMKGDERLQGYAVKVDDNALGKVLLFVRSLALELESRDEDWSWWSRGSRY